MWSYTDDENSWLSPNKGPLATQHQARGDSQSVPGAISANPDLTPSGTQPRPGSAQKRVARGANNTLFSAAE